MANSDLNIGKKPSSLPPLVADYEDLDKKSIDACVDFLKFTTTVSGLSIGLYANFIRSMVSGHSVDGSLLKVLLFAPALSWLISILVSVWGIYPRRHSGYSGAEKEAIVVAIRERFSLSCRLSLISLAVGFILFALVSVYILVNI